MNVLWGNVGSAHTASRMLPTPTPIADFIYHWQSLIAVLIAGTFTLSAAGIAWRAVQRQIANQRAIARRNEDDALIALKEGSRELLGMMNLAWRAVDVFIANRVPENRQPNFSLVRSLRDAMPREDNLEALIEIAEQLGPTNRRRFLLFLNSVRWPAPGLDDTCLN